MNLERMPIVTEAISSLVDSTLNDPHRASFYLSRAWDEMRVDGNQIIQDFTNEIANNRGKDKSLRVGSCIIYSLIRGQAELDYPDEDHPLPSIDYNMINKLKQEVSRQRPLDQESERYTAVMNSDELINVFRFGINMIHRLEEDNHYVNLWLIDALGKPPYIDSLANLYVEAGTYRLLEMQIDSDSNENRGLEKIFRD